MHLDCCARVCLLVRAPYLLADSIRSYRTAHHLRRRLRFVPAEGMHCWSIIVVVRQPS